MHFREIVKENIKVDKVMRMEDEGNNSDIFKPEIARRRGGPGNEACQPVTVACDKEGAVPEMTREEPSVTRPRRPEVSSGESHANALCALEEPAQRSSPAVPASREGLR